MSLFGGGPVPQVRAAVDTNPYSYTGRILDAQYADAVAPRVSTALGAVESAVSMWSRCLAICTAKPEDAPELASVTPSWLALAGRELALRGRFTCRIVVRNGAVRLWPAAYVDAFGGVDPESWTYTLSTIGASHTETANLHAAEVLDIRYAPVVRDIDKGRSPLNNAAESVRLLFGATRNAGNEFAVGTARILSGNGPGAPGRGDDQTATDKRAHAINDAINTDPGVKYLGAGLEKVHRIGAELDEQTPHVLTARGRSLFAEPRCSGSLAMSD